MNNSYSQHTLDNGLTVLLKEMHTAPVISHWVFYRVGPLCETPGKTGISHWVEHMQFKGTERFPSGTAERLISRTGGIWNALTYSDWTAFYETLPADQVDLALDIESDRMVNIRYDAEEMESERQVILSELEGGENGPTYQLNRAIREKAFPSHPYGRETIGTREDLLSITRDELYGFYRNHYCPNNAVVIIAGDFDSAEMLGRVEAAYGKIPAGTVPQISIAPEGPIRNPETIRVQGAMDVDLVRMVWRAPAANDPDVYPLSVLDSILAGPSSLSILGGGYISNRTSRLYQKLVTSGKAAGIAGGFTLTLDPYLYSASVVMNPGEDPDEAVGLIREEIENIIRDGVTEAELEKARKQARAMYIFSNESVSSQASWLGLSAMIGDPSWNAAYLQALGNVTAEDVRRAAERWLSTENCLIGICSGK